MADMRKPYTFRLHPGLMDQMKKLAEQEGKTTTRVFEDSVLTYFLPREPESHDPEGTPSP